MDLDSRARRNPPPPPATAPGAATPPPPAPPSPAGAPPTEETAPATPGGRLKHFWDEYLRPFIVLALILFAFRSSVADWNDVPTGSMKPTVLEGDRIFVNKLAYDLKFPFTTWR